MKKRYFAWILTLALIVVVGGVYATWYYQSAVEDAVRTIDVELAAKGTIDGEITFEGDEFKFMLDDEDQIGPNHTAAIVDAEGCADSITVRYTPTYTPSPDPAPAPTEEGIKMQWKLSIGEGTECKVTVGSEEKIAFSVDGTVQHADAAATTTFDITKDEVRGLISTALELPTEADYDAFKAAWDALGADAKKITLTVSKVAD